MTLRNRSPARTRTATRKMMRRCKSCWRDRAWAWVVRLHGHTHAEYTHTTPQDRHNQGKTIWFRHPFSPRTHRHTTRRQRHAHFRRSKPCVAHLLDKTIPLQGTAHTSWR